MGIVEKFAVGALGLIALYLILSKPQGDQAVGTGITNAGVGITKALQGR